MEATLEADEEGPADEEGLGWVAVGGRWTGFGGARGRTAGGRGRENRLDEADGNDDNDDDDEACPR